MSLPRRQRLLRIGTILPAVITAVAGVTVALVIPAAPATPPSPAAFSSHAPIGALDSRYISPGGVRAVGWDLDPDSAKTALTTFARIDGKWVGHTIAALNRPDIAKAHPSAGARHGFDWFIPVPEGNHTVCVAAQNVAAGANYSLGCMTRTFDYGPYGAINTVSAAHGSIHATGWTIDNDNVKAPVTTTITVDGKAHQVTANKSRPDVASAHKGAGAAHGFDETYAVPQGSHTVCVSAASIGFGLGNSLGCKTVTLNDSPVGKVDPLAQQSGKLRLRGWAFDPDQPTTALTLTLKIDSTPAKTLVANLTRTDLAQAHPNAGKAHGFDQLLTLSEGSHKICLTANNVSFGSTTTLICRSAALNFTPTASLLTITATSTGASVTGWATDPDTSAAISARITVDGRTKSTVVAKAAGSSHSGHNFAATVPMTSGRHTVCAIGLNVLYGHANSSASCRTITLALKPLGKFEKLARATGSNNLAVTGWTLDPDTTSPLSVVVTVDGRSGATVRAATARADVARSYPASGAGHGISSTIVATEGEHTVCLTAKNVGGGSDLSLGCKLIIAVHPVVPSAPRSVRAVAGYSAATVTWTKPTTDGGAPWTKYVVTASPGGRTATAGATATSATVTGLKPKASYTFTVRAVNVAGTSSGGTSPRVTTQDTPPPQRTPAPVSTSRYIRNIRGSSSAELATMRREGAADAKANPSGHAYMVLLDIGGQDQYNNGVVLSATTRYVSYADLTKDLKAYADGYHSAQKVSAPVTIAVGTNNDMDVNATTGKAWATQVINPLRSYATRYAGMTIAGANDIEPGFRAGYSQTRSWLSGYLTATSAAFVFNGSADGCAWTVTNRGCNNGWSMAGLYNLAAGASPVRMLNLPQIYNNTMADQWKYISLTGVASRQPRIRFGGPLTELTACVQSGSCGSLSGRSAWSKLWQNLQSDSRLKVSSLPYATDLRIDR
jgi:hypothetical protein